MLRRNALAAALVLAIAATPAVKVQQAGYYYLDPRAIDLTVLLPPPPDAGTAEERTDEQQVAQAVTERSAQQVAEARLASHRSVFFFARSIGPGFTPERLPETTKFFEHVNDDVHALVLAAKAYWQRPRPNGAGKKHASYPSGHAAFAASTAIVLAQLLPDKRDAIFAQARIFAANRILLGLHYPTDIASGWTAGTLAAFVMMRDAAFQRDFARVQAELRNAHLTPARAAR